MMTFDKYLYKTVRLTTKDGRVCTGPVCSFECEVESKSGHMEISIAQRFCIQVFEETEIESIEVLGE